MKIETTPCYVIDGVPHMTVDKAASTLMTNLIGSGKENGGGEAERIANLILSHSDAIAEILAWAKQENRTNKNAYPAPA